MFRFRWPTCKKPIELPAKVPGLKVSCPSCTQNILIPGAPPKTPAPPDWVADVARAEMPQPSSFPQQIPPYTADLDAIAMLGLVKDPEPEPTPPAQPMEPDLVEIQPLWVPDKPAA